MADDRDRAQQPNIIVEDETLRDGFTQIPNAILRRADLSPGAKLTYMTLLSYAWGKDRCFPGQDTLADDMGVTTRSVISYLKQLQDAGLLKVKRRGLGLTNLYILPKFSGSISPTRTSRSENSSHPDLKRSTAPEVKDFQVEEDSMKKTKIENLESSNTREVETGERLQDQETTATGEPAKPRGQAEAIGTVLKRRGRPPKSAYADPDRQVILDYVADFAREFADRAPLSSSTTRAYNLYQSSGVELATFIGAMQQARSIVKERTGSIRARTDGGDRPGVKAKMGYWFSVLEDLLGLCDERQPPTSTA